MNSNSSSSDLGFVNYQDYLWSFLIIIVVILVILLVFLKDKKLRNIAGHFKVLFEYHEGEKFFRERILYCIREYAYCGFTLFLVIFAILYGIRVPPQLTHPLSEIVKSITLFSLVSAFSILFLIRSLATTTIYYHENEYKEASRTAQRFIFGLVSIVLFGAVFSIVRLAPYWLYVLQTIKNREFTIRVTGDDLTLTLCGIGNFLIGFSFLVLICGFVLELILEYVFPKFGNKRIIYPKKRLN